MTAAFAKNMTPEAADLLRECAEKIDRPAAYVLALRMGFSQTETARALGVSQQAVDQWGKYNGVKFLPDHKKVIRKVVVDLIGSNHGQELTRSGVAEVIGVSVAAVDRAKRATGAKLKRQPMPRPTGEKIAALAAEGLTVGEVADKLGIPQPNVSQAKKRYGITFRRDARCRK